MKTVWNTAAVFSTSASLLLALIAQFQFRAEYFNLINRDNLGNPISAVGSGGFGSIKTAISPRSAQFSAKLIF